MIVIHRQKDEKQKQVDSTKQLNSAKIMLERKGVHSNRI